MKISEIDVLSKIKNNYESFSKGQKLVAKYILKNYDTVAFMKANKLAKESGVSEPTVARFAIELGFSGYQKFQICLQEAIESSLSSVQKVEIINENMDEYDVYKSVMRKDLENIKSTIDNLDKNKIDRAVKSIINAKKVYIIGLRNSSVLADFLSYHLNTILKNVVQVRYGFSDIFEDLLQIDENDILIGIGFPRYATRTIDALEFCHARGVKILGITDRLGSPIAKIADENLIAKTNMSSFIDSLVAPFSLINALIVNIGLTKKDEISDIYSNLENVWKEYNVYY